jgi:hypothetical protein
MGFTDALTFIICLISSGAAPEIRRSLIRQKSLLFTTSALLRE